MRKTRDPQSQKHHCQSKAFHSVKPLGFLGIIGVPAGLILYKLVQVKRNRYYLSKKGEKIECDANAWMDPAVKEDDY